VACRTCRLLKVHPDADGKVRIRKARAYHCSATIEPLRLPKSVSRYTPPMAAYMEPDMGEGCSYHEER
jgi:hypothetical protein